MTERRVIQVESLARVEGSGALHLTLEDGRITDLRLEIYEPPRFFEGFLRGRGAAELADLVARICGICPVAYQMCALQAVESAFGVTLDPEVRALRRLYACGEWLESHLLHLLFLAAPDYLGLDDAIGLARIHPAELERGLRLRKLGHRLVALLGGRATHPVGACIGGFSRLPRRRELRELAGELDAALPEAEALLRFLAALPLPSRPRPMELVSLRHPDEYPMNEGRIVSTEGLDLAPAEFDSAFVESQVAHSTALHCRRRDDGSSYLVGPLARVALNAERLPPAAAAALAALAPRLPAPDPPASLLARGIECLAALEEARRIAGAVDPPPRPAAEWAPRAALAHAAVEAPRGLLAMRIETDARGDLVAVRIVPPTSQNQARIEDDLRELLPDLLALSEEEARRACETAIRCYDPCISCSTHFLRLTIERRGHA